MLSTPSHPAKTTDQEVENLAWNWNWIDIISGKRPQAAAERARRKVERFAAKTHEITREMDRYANRLSSRIEAAKKWWLDTLDEERRRALDAVKEAYLLGGMDTTEFEALARRISTATGDAEKSIKSWQLSKRQEA
jgi:hypothetical protein